MNSVLKIEKIIFGGDGLARLPNGKIVFIPYTIPGEIVEVELIRDYGDYIEGKAKKILERSSERIDPLCEYYGICGGCQFQHIRYSYQIVLKEQILIETFKRLGWKEDIPLDKVIPSPKEFFYRNRLRFHIENEDLKMGFIKRKTHEVLKIESCLLGEKNLNKVLLELYKNPSWLKLSVYSKRMKIESSPEENKVTLLFWTSLKPKRRDLENLFSIKELKSVFYWIKGERPKGPFPENSLHGGRRVFKNVDGLFYYVQPGVFIQANWDINCAIMEIIKSLNLSIEKVLDLYSGMGNFLFAFIQNKNIKKFLGVDIDLRAIEDGIYTAEKAGINGRLDLRNMSAIEALYSAIKEGEKYDLVILDPPRGGCKELMKLLPEVAEKYIIYISCDAPTLVRDLLDLRELKYVPMKIYLFDMFPQTYHFETVVLLEKIK